MEIEIQDVQNEAWVRQVKIDGYERIVDELIFNGDVYVLAASYDGRRSISIWSLETGQRKATDIVTLNPSMWGMDMLSTGELIVYGQKGVEIRI